MDFFDPPYGGSNKGFPVQGLGTPAGVFHPGWGGTPPTQRMYVVDFGVFHPGAVPAQRIHVAFVFPCAVGTGKNGLRDKWPSGQAKALFFLFLRPLRRSEEQEEKGVFRKLINTVQKE